MRALKRLFTDRHKPLAGAKQDNFVAVVSDSEIVSNLDSPQYHLVACGETNTFSGLVLSLGKRTVRNLTVSSRGKVMGTFPVDSPRENIAHLLPHIPAAGRCGFDFELYVEADAEEYIFDVVFDDSSRELLFTYDFSFVRQAAHKFQVMKKIIDRISLPDGALVFLTQGHHDVKAYRDSIIPCIMNIRRYVQHSGIDFDRLRTVLDFGCGSGRALVGWYAENPERRLFGCDLNEELISWAKRHLPDGLHLDRNFLNPPLPYSDRTFDMIQAISVFTHLALDTQRLWIQEFKRVLKPGGYLLVTLHGEIYLRLTGNGLEAFNRSGYSEKSDPVEGSNSFASVHAPAFTRKLFDGFEILGHFPMGKIENERILFQIASQQDVFLLKYTVAGMGRDDT
jgi:SAM-dependent methyltransferase